MSLASYVIPNKKAFKSWYDRVTSRLQVLYPRVRGDYFGDVVPREALDVENPFNPNDSERLINIFLSGLDPKTNRFLSPSDNVLFPQWDGPLDEEPPQFVQIPYRFNLGDDRLVRGEL